MSGALPTAVLLAGGLGTRIRALAGDTPKVLLPVAGRPFLANLLESLAGRGVTEVVLCLGFAADRVWDAALTHCPVGLSLRESREATPLGTGGAIRQALDLLPGTFFILNGDTYLEVSLGTLLGTHRRAGAALTLSLVRSEDAAEKGSVRLAPDGRVLDFAEKVADGTGLVNAGVYVAEARVFSGVAAGAVVSLEREILPALLRRGDLVVGTVVDGAWVDIGLPENYLEVRDQFPPSGDRT